MVLCYIIFFVIVRRPPRSTRTDTLLPYTTLFRSNAATERIAHHRHLVYAKPVEQGGHLVDPDLLVFDPALGIGIAKPEHVRRNDAKALRQFGNVEPHVGPGRYARTRPRDQLDRSRSEERGVGKECRRTGRSRWSRVHY